LLQRASKDAFGAAHLACDMAVKRGRRRTSRAAPRLTRAENQGSLTHVRKVSEPPPTPMPPPPPPPAV
jgi:hypothetical protein